jgi:ribosomal protein S27AE
MRVHPISVALRYLKGKRTIQAAPYLGGPLFPNEEAAVRVLRLFTGRDFGTDADRWSDWLRRNRWVYYASSDDPRLKAPECSHCRGDGKVDDCPAEDGPLVSRRISCPRCGGYGILTSPGQQDWRVK